jgi:hypothetical protein
MSMMTQCATKAPEAEMTDTNALYDRLITLRRSVEQAARTQATQALDRALDRVGLVRKRKRTRSPVAKKKAARRPAARAKKA